MSRFRTLALSLVAAAGAVVLLTMTAPRAAHALAVALVQVANTAAAPAVTQDVSRLAAQNVELTCSPACSQINNDGATTASFTVPANQRLVITTLQLNLTGGGSVQLSQTNSAVITTRMTWLSFAGGTYQYQYPSGIVFASGTSGIAINGSVVANAYLFGYLSSNGSRPNTVHVTGTSVGQAFGIGDGGVVRLGLGAEAQRANALRVLPGNVGDTAGKLDFWLVIHRLP